MSCIVYQKDKKTGNIHAYSSTSHRNPETKRVITKKVYLGRVDPVTNEIIPKAEKGKRKRLISTNERESIIQDVREEARKDIDKLTTELNEVRDELSRVSTKLGQLLDFKKSVSEALQRVQKVD